VLADELPELVGITMGDFVVLVTRALEQNLGGHRGFHSSAFLS
jgi:hypothetical protein